MQPRYAVLLGVMLFALAAITVALLAYRPRIGGNPAGVGPSRSVTEQASVQAAEQVELSRALPVDERVSKGLAPPGMTAMVPEPKLPTEADWAVKYAGLTGSELEARSKALFEDLGARTNPELKKLYDAGQYEVLDEGLTHQVSKEEKALSGMWMLVTLPPAPGKPDGEHRRVVLPESQYPELYAVHREEVWLRQRARDQKDIEWRQANAAGAGSSPR